VILKWEMEITRFYSVPLTSSSHSSSLFDVTAIIFCLIHLKIYKNFNSML
jgi:hypothetical protein